MRIYPKSSISEFLDNRVVYRNLVPVDSRLPGLQELRADVGIPAGRTPRKTEPAYARLIVEILKQAHALERSQLPIQRLVYLGDTRLNDGTAFSNLCRNGGWSGVAFIGAETRDPVRVDVNKQEDETLYLANRWAMLGDFDQFCRRQNFPIDERTVIIIDLDKTALGARGRNDQVIDRVRVNAVRRTIGDLLKGDFDPVGFQKAYDHLNQPEYHPFTADNQDYLAYICLILSSGWCPLEKLISDIKVGRLTSFHMFIAEVDKGAGQLSSDLRSIHEEVLGLVKGGDPTPFKAFRYNEYISTVECMGFLDDDASVEIILQEEIALTHEVREIALNWRAQGALLFGLSDKPDEASIPVEELAHQGYQAIHQVATHAVGG